MIFIYVLWIIIILTVVVNAYLLIDKIRNKKNDINEYSTERINYDHDIHSENYEISREQARISSRINQHF